MGLEWIQEYSVLLVCIIVWDVAWRGVALWYAARNGAKAWYVVMLLINSAGILPILYLLLGKDKHGRSLT
jgi:hypothetical protein